MYSVKTEHPIALDSPDHLHPMGTKMDNHFNLEFNKHVMKIIPERPLSVLDLGCAGGAMVKSFIDMGQVAIGIEGSDYCQVHQLHEWSVIPGNLFTADARQPFQVKDGRKNMQFDLITHWEFFEHINPEGLDGVVE